MPYRRTHVARKANLRCDASDWRRDEFPLFGNDFQPSHVLAHRARRGQLINASARPLADATIKVTHYCQFGGLIRAGTPVASRRVGAPSPVQEAPELH